MKKTLRVIAILVSITLFFQELPVIAAKAAEEPPEHVQEAELPGGEESGAEIVEELVEKRTETEKYFLMSDGTFQIAQYEQPVHYKDGNGYTEINNELVEATDEQGDAVFKNTDSDLHVMFAGKADSRKLVTVSYGGHEISWGFVLEGRGGKGKRRQFSKHEKDSRMSRENGISMENTRLAAAGSYMDLYPGVDVEYELISKQLKENIILRNKKAASQALVIDVTHRGLTAAKTPEGSICFSDDADKSVYLFEAPYMYDSAGEMSDDVRLDIVESKDGKTRIKVVPDAQWLTDSTRAFPVTIDPITKTAQSANHIETRYYTQNSKNLRSYGVLYAGNQKGQMGLVKTAVRFDLPDLPDTTTVLEATMYLAHRDYSAVGVSTSTVNVCEITEGWEASESVPGVVGEAPGHSPYAQDYNTLGADTKKTMVSWDITGIASQWFNGTLDNHGVLVYPQDPDEWALTDFVSPQNTGYGSGALPILVIHYREACGLEDYWSYSTQDCGRYGKGYVNNYNGNLVYIHEDASFQSVINGFTLAHVYNTCESGTEGRYGKGWRLNLVQRLEPVSISGFSEYKYVYTDGDGTRHYFYENEKGGIIDEDGLGYTVSDYPGTELTKKITTKDGTQLIFDIWHYLRVIRDTNGNTINMNYSPIPNVDNYLTSITTSSGGAILLHYDSEYKLVSIEDNAGRVTHFNRENGLLKRIVYPDGITADLDYYDSWFHGISASDGTELVYYNYVKHGKIYCAKKKSSEHADGEYYLYSYGHNQTTIRDHFGRTVTYQFDSFGRAVCVFDDEKNVSSQQYTVSSNAAGEAGKNNKVTSVSNAAVYVDNLIKNPVFSDGLSYWVKYNEAGISSAGGNDTFLGGNSVRMHNDSEAITAIMQPLSVETGTRYTLSAYIKAEDVVSERLGAGLEVVTTGRYLYSDMLTGTTDTAIQDGYRRVSLTFELAAGESLNRITAGLYNATGTAYATGIQLEKGEVCNTTNLLSNSGFEQGAVYWTAGTDDTGACRNVSDSFEGNSAYRIDGKHDRDRSVSQTVYCSGNAGAVFAFGAWTKGYSVQGHEETSLFSLECTLHYTDGSEKTETFGFNTVVNAWQFGMKNIVAEKPYSHARVTFRYNKNCNFAVLDDVFLYRDTVQSFRYDDKGNVVATSDYASQRSEYKYNNDSISRLLTPEGSSYEYMYDEKKNNTASRSGDGLLYRITYDASGNPVRSDITASGSTASIKDGGIYRIRLKYTGKYLTLKNAGTASGTKVVQAPFDGGDAQKWRVEKTTDGYYRLRPVSAATLALDFDSSDEAVAAGASGTDSQKLALIAQSDYTYKLLVKSFTTRTLVTVNYSAQREAVVALYEMGIENNPEQEWYFEEAESTCPDTIEEGIYQIQARAMGRVFTVSGEDTIEAQANIYSDAQRFVIRPVAGTEYHTISPAGDPGKFLCCPSGEEGNGITLTDDGMGEGTRFQIVKGPLADSYKIIPAADTDRRISLSDGGYEDTRTVVLAESAAAPEGLFALVRTSQSITTSQSYQYNGNLPCQVTDARGNTTTYTYDHSRGLQTAVTDAKGNVTSYTYNANNDWLQAVSAGGSTVNYAYNPDGRISSITSPSGTAYGFTYDTYKRQTGVTAGGAQLSTTQYKNNYKTLIDTLTYGNGNSVGYHYDRLDRLTEKLYNGSVAARYTYDRLGRLARTEDLLHGTVTEQQYDLTGRLISIRNRKNTADAADTTCTWNRADTARLEYAYDDLSRVSRIRQTAAGSSINYDMVYSTANTDTKKLGKISGISVNGTQILDYEYDVLGRSARRTLGTATPFVTEYSYLPGADASRTTALVQTVKNGGDTCSYTYDELGNITSVGTNGTVTESYTYDALGQLTEAVINGDTYTYTYDAGGNITAGTKNGETVAVYGYGNPDWKDLLTSYNGVSITYDGIGNPLKWKNGETFTWSNGRQLSGIIKDGSSISYTYNADGERTGKDVGGVKTEYYWLNGLLLGEKTGSDQMSFLYDESGRAFGLILNGVYYYYVYNLQGDVTGILDSDGTVVVSYRYNAWGEIESISGTLADTIGQKNPLRYRGYYYDGETGFYYLRSRYYDSEVGRFLNADGYVSTGQDILGTNMYAYCGNNPVSREDSTGHLWSELWEFVRTAASEIGAAISNLAPAYAGCGGAAVADGPLPFGDALAITGAALLTVGAIGYGIYQTSKSTAEKTRAKGKAVAIPQSKKKQSTVVYRYGGTNPGNLTPKEKDRGTGLSFSTIPKPGAAMTTIEALNATHIVYAIKDGATHVSVYPIGGTMDDWIDIGSSSIWTQAVKSVVVKWDGVY